MLPDYIVKNWTEGLVTRIESTSLPKGAAKSCLNWHFSGDKIELRRGQYPLGDTVATPGKCTGLRVSTKLDGDGTQVLHSTYGRKVRYYDTSTELWDEIDTDILPALADGEDISLEPYYSIAGAFLYLSSPNTGIYKIPTANPTSYVDLQSKSHRGRIKIKNGSMYLWDRRDTQGGSDRTGLYRGRIDKDELSDYTYIDQEEIGTGNGVLTTFTDNLVEVVKSTAANVKRTAMYVRIAAPVGAAKTITAITKAADAQITATAHGLSVGDYVLVDGGDMVELIGIIAVVQTVPTADTFTIDTNSTGFTTYTTGGTVSRAEVFVDDRAGGLTAQSGTAGASGTVNYATGAVSITTATAVTNTKKIYADYYYEDSTSLGIADFTKSVTRLPTEAFTLRQDDGGYAIQNLFTLEGEDYAIHTNTTWKSSIASDDETASNLVWNPKIGMKYWRGGSETSLGIIYVDTTDPNEPVLRRIQISDVSIRAKPISLSDKVDLSPYEFDKSVVYEWGNFIIFSGRNEDSEENDRMFIYNKLWKTIEVHDCRVSVLQEYLGTLIAGDSATPNVFTLFSGLTDEESEIPNYFESGYTDIGYSGVKVTKRGVLKGLIGIDQEFDFQLSYDNGPYVTVATFNGRGAYVDQGQRVLIGPNVLGSTVIGGGGDGIEAHPFNVEFRINSPRYTEVSYRFEAKAIGYLGISDVSLKDNRKRARRISSQYTVNP